jgi:hypothetical protein
MFLGIIVGLVICSIIIVSTIAFIKLGKVEKTLDDQKNSLSSDTITAGTLQTTVGAVKGNMAIGSNLGVFGNFEVAKNVGVVGNLVVGQEILSKTLRSSNVFSESSASRYLSGSNLTSDYGYIKTGSFSNATFSNATLKSASIDNATFSKYAVFNDRVDFENSLCMTNNGQNVCMDVQDMKGMKTLISSDIINLHNTLNPISSQLVGISSNLSITDAQALKGLAAAITPQDASSLKTTVASLSTDVKSIKSVISSSGSGSAGSSGKTTYVDTYTQTNVPLKQKIGMEFSVQNGNKTIANWYTNKSTYVVPMFGDYKISIDCYVNDGTDNIYGEWIVSLNSENLVYVTPSFTSHPELKLYVEEKSNIQWWLGDNDGRITSNYSARITITSYNLGNVVSGAGTLGPTILLHWGFQDVKIGSRFTLSKEPGNTADGMGDAASGVYPLFQKGFLGLNSSGENLTWNRARFIVRAVNLGDASGAAKVRVQQFHYQWGFTDLTPQFEIWASAQQRGYATSVSPWFSLKNLDVPGLAIIVDACPSNNTMRFGPVHIQFAS